MIDRYRDPYVTNIWSDSNKITNWCLVERLAARAQADLNIIPRAAADEICEHLIHATEKTVADVADEEREHTGHDFVAFLNVWRAHLRRQGCDEGARWLHHGFTSSDIQDTTMAINLVTSSNYLRAHLVNPLVDLLKDLADQHMGTVRVARTHGQYAEPTTLGVKLVEWLELVRRAEIRLETSQLEVGVGKLSGPVGSYAHNPPQVETATMDAFGLEVARGCSQIVTRDRLAHWAHCVAGLATACEQVALDFWLLAQSGVEEVREGTRVGSSSMPHKRNPVTSEKIQSLADWARRCSDSLQRYPLGLERTLTHSARERIAIPSLLHAVAHVLKVTDELLRGAQFDAKRMLQNLDDAGHAPYTSGVALALVRSGETREWSESAAVAWMAHEPDADALFEGRPGVREWMTHERYIARIDGALRDRL